MLYRGFDQKRRLTNLRSVTEKRVEFNAKKALNNKKTGHFDRFFRVTLGGPDGRKLPTYYEGIELLSPGIKPSEAFMVLDYRRKRDLE